jgi:hypothetical protein
LIVDVLVVNEEFAAAYLQVLEEVDVADVRDDAGRTE